MPSLCYLSFYPLVSVSIPFSYHGYCTTVTFVIPPADIISLMNLRYRSTSLSVMYIQRQQDDECDAEGTKRDRTVLHDTGTHPGISYALLRIIIFAVISVDSDRIPYTCSYRIQVRYLLRGNTIEILI